MGVFSGGASPPAPDSLPDPIPPPPREVDPKVKSARQDDRRRAAAAGSRKSTILTNPLGLPSENTTEKSLLGT